MQKLNLNTTIVFISWMLLALSFGDRRAWYLLIPHSWHIKVSHSKNTDIMLCHRGATWGRSHHLLTSLSHKHETREGCRPERWGKGEVEGGSEEEEKGKEGKENKRDEKACADSETLESAVAPMVADTWNMWRSTWESRAAALPEMTGFWNCSVGYFWVFLEPRQCRGRD